MPMIMELPMTERPREKLLGQGSKNLSNTELLAILIGTGTSKESAITLASRVLAEAKDGINSLVDISPEELKSIRGIGNATSCRILAAVELGRRISSSRGDEKIRIGCPDDVALMLMEELRLEKQECLIILLLNVKNEVIGKELISKGGISSSIVDPRDVFRPAIRRGAAGIIAVHNHPSGNPEPSESDILVTKKLVESGELLGIELIDHVIIGNGRHISLKNRKMM